MQGFRLPSTILNLTQPRRLPSIRDGSIMQSGQVDEATSPEIDEELKMPKKASLIIVILANVMLQASDDSLRPRSGH